MVLSAPNDRHRFRLCIQEKKVEDAAVHGSQERCASKGRFIYDPPWHVRRVRTLQATIFKYC